MRLTSLLLAILLLVPSAAFAGDRDNPDVTDTCGDREIVEPNHYLASNDVCAGWVQADVTGEDVVLDLTVQTLEPSVDDARIANYVFTDGDCRWYMEWTDTAATVESQTIGGDGGPTVRLLPGQRPAFVRVQCGEQREPCYDVPAGGTCITYDRQATFEVDRSVGSVDGDTISFHLDLSTLPLEGSPVEDDGILPGAELTSLVMAVTTSPTNAPPRYVAVVSGSGPDDEVITTRNTDAAYGGSFTVPVPEDD